MILTPPKKSCFFFLISFLFSRFPPYFIRGAAGYGLVRCHLYAWAVCMVAPSKNGYLINGEIGKRLSDRYQELRKSVKGKDALMRILFKATRMLFYELLNELNP